MAVLPYLKASVIVNGNALPEYDVDQEDLDRTRNPHAVVKYIEAISDAEFSVDLTINRGYEGSCELLGWQLHIDGKNAASIPSRKDCFKSGKCITPNKSRLDGRLFERDGQNILQRFKFSQISFAEAQDSQGEQVPVSGIADVGTLRVTLWRYQIVSMGLPLEQQSFNPLGKLPEKSLKGTAVSHTVALGSSRVAEHPSRIAVNHVGETPTATFIFKYRSRKALQDLMVIPRSPSPSPPLEDRPVESLTTEEMRKLIRRQRAEVAIKQEVPPGIKRERQESILRISSSPTPRRDNGSAVECDSDIEYTGSRQLKKPKIEINLLDD